MAGEVDGEALHRVLDHRDPRTGTRLTRAQGAPKVPGFDATFCAPKSVSLLFALGDPGVTNDRSVARADLPPYAGPSEPAGGHVHEWGATIADDSPIHQLKM